jgi:electron transfer flavoprotein alpha subunit
MKNIGVIIETDKGKIKEACFGMITLARAKGARLFAVVLDQEGEGPNLKSDLKSGLNSDIKADLEAFGITKIIAVSVSPGRNKNPVVRAKAVIEAISAHDLDTVFALSTARGKDLLPRIAALAGAPLVMDCFSVDFEKNQVKTSQYSGKTIAVIELLGKVSVVGVRPNAVEPCRAETTALADLLFLDASDILSRNLQVVKAGEADRSAAVSLAEAEVIVAGGRGMKNKENFSLIAQCAERLNAAVGASRVAVDSGWVPYSMQVGQTGEKVSPRVYIAWGISGSIQHFAGMKTSGMVIAVNTDENAAIMSNCDYYVKADVLDILPELINVLDNG